MSDETRELQQINGNHWLRFTEIFRTFRLAIHPSKVGLALIGILLTSILGLVMDRIWSMAGRDVLPGEITASLQHSDVTSWRHRQTESGKAILSAIMATDAVGGKASRKLKTDDEFGEALADLPGDIRQSFRDARKDIEKKNIEKNALRDLYQKYSFVDENRKPPNAENLELLRAETMQLARRAHTQALAQVRDLAPRGIFASLLQFERDAIRQAAQAACTLNLTGDMMDIFESRSASSEIAAGPRASGLGLIPSVILMAFGLRWLVVYHWLYAVIFLLGSLAIWSIFGGAICRIAALHAAREERINVKSAIAFARRKFAGYAAAPLVPMALLVFIGVVLAVGGVVGTIPVIGELLAGLLFGLALLGGFVMALVSIGTAAGGSLMWPTIAVEGSDSFDAISRSFSYVYSKPWRSAFYALVACVYGAICFLFVRFFVFLMLKLTHLFVGMGMGVFTSRPGVGDGATKLDAMWLQPSFEALMPKTAMLGTQGIEGFGGLLIGLWISLIVAISYAFLVSFYYCGSTIIYLMLRREVDATDFEDVYLDEIEEEEALPISSALPVTPAPAAAAPAAPAAPAPPPVAPPPPPPPPPAAETGSGPTA